MHVISFSATFVYCSKGRVDAIWMFFAAVVDVLSKVSWIVSSSETELFTAWFFYIYFVVWWETVANVRRLTLAIVDSVGRCAAMRWLQLKLKMKKTNEVTTCGNLHFKIFFFFLLHSPSCQFLSFILLHFISALRLRWRWNVIETLSFLPGLWETIASSRLPQAIALVKQLPTMTFSFHEWLVPPTANIPAGVCCLSFKKLM